MAEETGSKDDPRTAPAAKSASSAPSDASASRKTRTKKSKATTAAKKTSATSRARTGKASGATAARSKAKRPAARKTSAAAAASDRTADARTAARDHRTEAPAGGSQPASDDVETIGRGRDEFWRALGIIGFGTVSVGLIGLATLGGLVQSVMRVSRPRETPPLTGFQKCVAAYLRQIVDYLAAPDTTADPPFPFSDFPGDASSAEPKRDSNA